MSALRRIRENVGLVIAVIAISLFSFIFVDLIRNFGGGPDDTVATVNGQDISYNQLQAKLQMVERTAGEMETGEQRDQVRIDAWQSLIREAVYKNEWEKAGIMLTEDELNMVFRGVIPHPYVQRSGFFNDSTGVYNPAMVDAAFAQADQINLDDPQVPDEYKRWKQGLIDLRTLVSLDRMGAKWQGMIAKAMLVSDNEATRAHNEEQRSANISYVYVPYASISDSAVAVSESDYSEYYGKRKPAFKREKEVKIKYTFFQVNPSSDDSTLVRDNLVQIKGDFLADPQAWAYASTNSDAKVLISDTISKPIGELPAALIPYANRTDTVIGPVRTDAGMALYRVVRVEEDSASVLSKVRHILLKVDPANDSNAVATKARDLQRKIQGDSSTFAATALTESKDMTNSALGGSLGWLGTSQFGADFDKAVRDASVGSVVVVKSPAGTHVVQVTERSRKRYGFATIVRNIVPGSATNEAVYKRASAYQGDVMGGTDMDAALANYPEAVTRVSPVITQSTYQLFGLSNSRPIITWAFQQDAGAVSETILEADRAFVVARVEYAGDKGYKSLDDVKEEIRPEVIRYVKARDIKKKLSSGGADLQAIAASYGPGASTGAAMDIRFSTNNVQNLGEEPKVVGRAFGMKQGEISKPIAGNNGVFVIKLDAVTEPGAPLAPEMLAFRKMSLKQSKSSGAVNASFSGLIDIADIYDYRAKFEF